MKSDIAAIIILIGLAIATFLLCGQRSMQIDAVNARIALLEAQVGHGNIPRIEISRGTVYTGMKSEIIIKGTEDGKK